VNFIAVVPGAQSIVDVARRAGLAAAVRTRRPA